MVNPRLAPNTPRKRFTGLTIGKTKLHSRNYLILIRDKWESFYLRDVESNELVALAVFSIQLAFIDDSMQFLG